MVVVVVDTGGRGGVRDGSGVFYYGESGGDEEEMIIICIEL